MFKVCTTCRKEKALTDFRKDSRRLDGLQSWCKQCAREHHKSAYTSKYGDSAKVATNVRMNKAKEWLLEYKRSRGCCSCPEQSVHCLTFHHIDPREKDFTLGASLSRSLSKIQQEVSKCVVVCRNCHAKIHAGEIELLIKAP
jgi:hypothetical protein